MRVQFTEIWFPIEKTEEVYDRLVNLFKEKSNSGGNLGVEVYGAKASPFWLSMSFERNVLRIDPYWWEHNKVGKLYDFFNVFWKSLLEVEGARCHWGKHQPHVGEVFRGIKYGPDYMRDVYPKFDKWLEKRAKFDPQQKFMTGYWRGLLGVEKTDELKNLSA
jgi:D-arabinono-1,4-lactone oxidase